MMERPASPTRQPLSQPSWNIGGKRMLASLSSLSPHVCAYNRGVKGKLGHGAPIVAVLSPSPSSTNKSEDYPRRALSIKYVGKSLASGWGEGGRAVGGKRFFLLGLHGWPNRSGMGTSAGSVPKGGGTTEFLKDGTKERFWRRPIDPQCCWLGRFAR